MTRNPKLDNDEQIDRLIDEHLDAPPDDLQPSSGFVLSVMHAIEAEATEPPPIPFPWRRVIPGIIAALVALAALIVVGIRTVLTVGHATATTVLQHGPAALTHVFTGGNAAAGWALLAGCMSVIAVVASLRLAKS